MTKFTAIDLFAGGGGLSEGLKQAGFDVVAAVEIDGNAATTYEVNHKKTKIITTDIRFVSAKTIEDTLNGRHLDLLAACPPCQSFSTLNAKYDESDPRNTLIKEVGRLVRSLKPKTIMIENVPGLATRGQPFLEPFLREIEMLGYKYNFQVLQVADYGVPQMRKRFVLLAGLGFEVRIPESTHSEINLQGKIPWVTVRDAIGSMPHPISLQESHTYGGPELFNWHVTRTLSPLNIARLKYVKAGGMRFDIPDELRPNCHKGNNIGYSNVYGRMAWGTPSPTITGGCTTLSKGRFGHPESLRTISVREAALLQSFPLDYKFQASSIDSVCKIIGNALPCLFARKMAEACKRQISIQLLGT